MAPLSDAEIKRHNAWYNKGCSLQKGLILLDDRPQVRLGFFSRRKLRKSIELLEQALSLNPTSWQSMLFIGKAHQALHEQTEALAWFVKANREASSNATVAKEAGLQAGRLGQHDLAIQIMEPAALSNPSDGALHVNLGLSCLLSGQFQAACFAFERACEVDPQWTNNLKLYALAKKVRDGEILQPTSEAEVAKYL